MDRKLIIYGAGGAGRELAYVLSLERGETRRWKVEGFVDDTEDLQGKIINGLPVLGKREYLEGYDGNLAVTIFDRPRIRKTLIERIKKNVKIGFPSLVSSTSIVPEDMSFNEGCIVQTLSFISNDVSMGKFALINGGTRIGHDSTIGDFTTIYSGIMIGGGVVIGDCCLIGSGATILPKVHVGKNSIVGAGAVVLKDVPEHVVVAGNPAKIIRENMDDS